MVDLADAEAVAIAVVSVEEIEDEEEVVVLVVAEAMQTWSSVATTGHVNHAETIILPSVKLVISVEPLNQEVEEVEVAALCEAVVEDLAVIDTSHTEVQTQQAVYIFQ
ncbi:hypothetical protein Y032_0281g1242 [Ancylostoma ceylanicum]|nr:hypothetical protein Y032_0281g1242 [Ancylostoma ceylanicum]